MDNDPDTTSVIRLIETPYKLEAQNIVCYPNLVLYFKIEIQRLFMKPRIVYSAITVDLVRGEAARSNMFPKSRPIEISDDALIPQLMSHEAATAAAQQVVMKWLRYKFRIYKVPNIELVRQQAVYKAFFYTKGPKDELLLVDSVEGIDLSDKDGKG